jgi:hypothetical protein
MSRFQRGVEQLPRAKLVILAALDSHCPLTRPCPLKRRAWSPECSALLREHRRARRRYTATQAQEDQELYKKLRNQLGRQIQRDTSTAWRRFIMEAVAEAKKGGLWRLSGWARKRAGKARTTPQLPPLRQDPHSPIVDTNEGKASILARRFFPPPAQADLSDINEDMPTESPLRIDHDVTPHEALERPRSAPKQESPRSRWDPNEALKACREEIAPAIAEIAKACFEAGYFPSAFRRTTTVVLRKDGDRDYSLSGSYRPIALENTLSKVVEGFLAYRITSITSAFEEHGLLPSTQMGARSGRSTLTALSLLTSTVHSVWQKDPGHIVSML